MAPHSSTLAWQIPWTEEPGRLQSMGSLRLRHDWATSLSLFHALEKEMATHSSVLAWRIPGTGEPGGLRSMGSHRVGHDWSDLASADLQEDEIACPRSQGNQGQGSLCTDPGLCPSHFLLCHGCSPFDDVVTSWNVPHTLLFSLTFAWSFCSNGSW